MPRSMRVSAEMASNQFFYPSSYAQTQGQATGTGNTSDAIEANAEGMSMIPGGFGTGFKVGYSAVNTTLGPFLAYRQARNEKRSLQMQADILRLQSQSYHSAADDAKRAGLNQAAAIGYQAGQTKSAARVRQAAGGVRVGGSGSSAEVLASIDISKEMQINQVIANSVAQSWGYRRSAVDYSNKALSYDVAAKGISPWAAAITNLVGSLTSMGKADSGKSEGATASPQDYAEFGSSLKNLFGSGSATSGMGGGSDFSSFSTAFSNSGF